MATPLNSQTDYIFVKKAFKEYYIKFPHSHTFLFPVSLVFTVFELNIFLKEDKLLKKSLYQFSSTYRVFLFAHLWTSDFRLLDHDES